jgi:hypothetical protein
MLPISNPSWFTPNKIPPPPDLPWGLVECQIKFLPPLKLSNTYWKKSSLHVSKRPINSRLCCLDISPRNIHLAKSLRPLLYVNGQNRLSYMSWDRAFFEVEQQDIGSLNILKFGFSAMIGKIFSNHIKVVSLASKYLWCLFGQMPMV